MGRPPSDSSSSSRPCRESALWFAFVAALVALAFLLRISYVERTEVIDPIRSDAKQYVAYGFNLAHTGTFAQSRSASGQLSPDSFRSPGYPALIALAFALGGDQRFYHLTLSMQAILGALLVGVTYLVGRLYMSRSASFAAAALVAVCPHLVSLGGLLLTETLFSVVLLSALLAYGHALKTGKHLLYALAGLMFGLAYLVNETALFLPVFLAMTVAALQHFGRIALVSRRNTVIFLTVFLVLPMLWIFRGWIHDIPEELRGSRRAIASLSHGAYPDFLYKSLEYQYFPYREDPEQPGFGSSLDGFIPIFWRRFQERPARYLRWYFVEKPYILWTWNELQGPGDIHVYPVRSSLYDESLFLELTRVTMKAFHPLLLVIALAGLSGVPSWFRRAQDRRTFLLAMTIPAVAIYFTLLYAVFAPWPRYGVPLRPVLYLWCVLVSSLSWAVVRRLARSGSNDS